MIDRSRLMQMFNNDEAIVDRFIAKFKEEAPSTIQLIELGIQNHDMEAVSLNSHNLKSHCSYLGLTALVEIAARLEALADGSGSSTELQATLSDLKQKLQNTIASMS